MHIRKICIYFLNLIGLNVTKLKPSPYEHFKLKRFKKKGKTHELILLGKRFKIVDSLSFYFSYREIFIDKIYNFNSSSKSPNILDLGSNVGLSIVFFKTIYPKSKIVGVEADPFIFKVLQNNIISINYTDIQLINKVVSDNPNKSLKFYQNGSDGGRIKSIEGCESVEVTSIDLDYLINEKIDFLKIDIEGSETDVLLSSNKLDKVENIFIEYHSFTDCKQTLDKILKKLTDNGFRYIIHNVMASKTPFTEKLVQLSMDLQLNIFAVREEN